MDSKEQAEGEARVRKVLVDGLIRQGLAKPGSLTKAQFEAMLEDLCERLAYMTPLNLAALAEEAAGFAGGRDKDRFPIAKVLLKRAADIQPPSDTGSPLMRAVFAAALGRDAIAEGWAPELRGWVRSNRRWPPPFVCKQLREEAEGPKRQLRDLEQRLARDGELPVNDARWRDRRVAALAACQEIADLAQADGSEGVA